MNIYVDDLRDCVPNDKWKWKQACHLFTVPGNLHNLHKFAVNALGLKKEFFQNKKDLPHYDLSANKRAEALRLGAVPATMETVVDSIHAWRKQRA